MHQKPRLTLDQPAAWMDRSLTFFFEKTLPKKLPFCKKLVTYVR